MTDMIRDLRDLVTELEVLRKAHVAHADLDVRLNAGRAWVRLREQNADNVYDALPALLDVAEAAQEIVSRHDAYEEAFQFRDWQTVQQFQDEDHDDIGALRSALARLREEKL